MSIIFSRLIGLPTMSLSAFIFPEKKSVPQPGRFESASSVQMFTTASIAL
jgi:hypothetical protein